MELKPHLLQIIKTQSALHGLSPEGYLEILIEQDGKEKHANIYVNAPYDDQGKWLQFTRWCNANPWKNLLYLEPLTRDQFYRLYQDWGFGGLCDILIQMENYRPIIKKRSIYQTALNWLRRTRNKTQTIHE